MPVGSVFFILIGIILGIAIIPIVGPLVLPVLTIVGAGFIIYKIISYFGGDRL
jgi:hypothetical protein